MTDVGCVSYIPMFIKLGEERSGETLLCDDWAWIYMKIMSFVCRVSVTVMALEMSSAVR